MRVAAVQFKPVRGAQVEALTRLQALARRGAGAELIVLPEMASTGYVFANRAEIAVVAEDVDGPTFTALSPVARELGAWVVVGFAERANDAFFNSALVIDPTGARRFVYRKTLLYDADVPWATPGDSGYRVFDTEHGSFTLGICMDLNDDRFVAWCRGAAARVVALPTNWLDEGEDVWSYWMWRMLGVPSALVAANTYGPEGALAFRGESAIIDRLRVLATAPATGDTVLSAELKAHP